MSVVHTVGSYRISDQVLTAVRDASAQTGIDFRYMMAKAATESAFRPDVRAATSNATGLYQFINSTWIAMVHRYGDRYGLEDYAAAIRPGSNGRLTVPDPAMRQEILSLRRDPELSALMAGEYANQNRDHLERTVGGRIGPTELYMAHFLGAHGSAQFLSAVRDAPQTVGAALFPAAAAANRPAFYDRETGRALSVQEIYDAFDRRVGRVMAMVDEDLSPPSTRHDVGPMVVAVATPPPAPSPADPQPLLPQRLLPEPPAAPASPPPAPPSAGNSIPGGLGYFAARSAPASFFAAMGGAANTGSPADTSIGRRSAPGLGALSHPAGATGAAIGPSETGSTQSPESTELPPPGGRRLSLWAVLAASS